MTGKFKGSASELAGFAPDVVVRSVAEIVL